MNIVSPQTLHVWLPKEVSSAKMLEIFVGTSSRRLLIFTGIAIPGFDSKGQLDGQEVTIDLNVKANEPNPPFTATVGLAGIYNTDSDLVFSTDDVRVITGENLELLLICNIAVMGDRSVLNRFSYQATVFLNSDTGTIEGNIRWDPYTWTFNTAKEQDLFQIEALSTKVVTNPGVIPNDPNNNPPDFGTIIYKVEKVGNTVGIPTLQGKLMTIPYELHDLPLGVPLTIRVTPKSGAYLVLHTSRLPLGQREAGLVPMIFVQVSGPSPVILGAGHLKENPVDFLAYKLPSTPL
jgi:hypothetical protein